MPRLVSCGIAPLRTTGAVNHRQCTRTAHSGHTIGAVPSLVYPAAALRRYQQLLDDAIVYKSERVLTAIVPSASYMNEWASQVSLATVYTIGSRLRDLVRCGASIGKLCDGHCGLLTPLSLLIAPPIRPTIPYTACSALRCGPLVMLRSYVYIVSGTQLAAPMQTKKRTKERCGQT